MTQATDPVLLLHLPSEQLSEAERNYRNMLAEKKADAVWNFIGGGAIFKEEVFEVLCAQWGQHQLERIGSQTLRDMQNA